MNWYSIFYWITVADGIKDFCDTMSNIFTLMSVLSFVVFIFLIIGHGDTKERQSEEENQSDKYWIKQFRSLFIWFTVLAFISWTGYVAVPTKKDALLIVAGGAVGQFITSDSSAKQIPAEAMTLLRDKIRAEIREVNLGTVQDTLANKTKEELIEMVKSQKQ